MPTSEQAFATIRVCQWLSNFYVDIHLFSYDAKYKDLTIIAGETIIVVVPPTGDLSFDEQI